jgi:hypothetical protein
VSIVTSSTFGRGLAGRAVWHDRQSAAAIGVMTASAARARSPLRTRQSYVVVFSLTRP